MNTPDRLRVGFIGANGRWGEMAHIPALRSLPQTEIYAVCTAHDETARAAAEKCGTERAYGNDKAMNANPAVEAALVSVRVTAHYELAKNALDAGKHVYCEWPLGRTTQEAEELAALARKKKLLTMVGLQRRASPAYMRMRELIQEGYVGQILSVNMTHMGSGILTSTSDRSWQRDITLGANPLTRTFGHAMDAVCMVAGELTEVASVVSTQVPQWYETDTKRYVDATAPDNIMIVGKLEGGAVVNAHLGVHPYHGTGYRFEVYGTEGTLAMVGGGDSGEEVKRRIFGGRKDDKSIQELAVPDRLKWVPKELQVLGPGYGVAQMWVRFAEAIRNGARVEPDFDAAVRRHRMLDAVVLASQTGQRQVVAL